MNYLIFFLLFPLIYEIIVGLLYFKYGDIDLYFDIFDSEAISSIVLTLILIAIDYLLEFFYFFICKKIFGQDILLMGYEESGFELKAFMFFLLSFSIVHIGILIYNIVDWDWLDFAPFVHTFILFICFIIFSFVMYFTNKICLNQKNFEEIEYDKEEYVYELNSIKDEFNDDIYLNIDYENDGYVVYYSYIDENDKTCFDFIKYSKNKGILNDSISIFEKKDAIEPLVKIIRNYKELNGYIYEYFDYEFTIPSGTIKKIGDKEQ